MEGLWLINYALSAHLIKEKFLYLWSSFRSLILHQFLSLVPISGSAEFFFSSNSQLLKLLLTEPSNLASNSYLGSFVELPRACWDYIATWIVKQVWDDFPAARVLLAIFFSSIFFQLIFTGATLIFFKVKKKFEQWEGLSGAWFGFFVVIDGDPSKVGLFEVLRGSGGGLVVVTPLRLDTHWSGGSLSLSLLATGASPRLHNSAPAPELHPAAQCIAMQCYEQCNALISIMQCNALQCTLQRTRWHSPMQYTV